MMSLELAARVGNWTIAAALAVTAFVLWQANKKEVTLLLSLRSRSYSPTAFLGLALVLAIAAYLASGAVFDFSSIRYLLLVWLIVPGSIAAACVSQHRTTMYRVVAALFLCWGIGQAALLCQSAKPHPLRPLAVALVENDLRVAVAEFQDAHVLSFLTQQKVHVAEFRCFWPRLAMYSAELSDTGPTNYVVRAGTFKDAAPWNFPGPAPPETRNVLRAELEKWLNEHPASLVSRTPLPEGFELVVLSSPMPNL